MKLKGKMIKIRESVPHADNDKHNYDWHFFKDGDEIPERLEKKVLELGGQLVDDKPKRKNKPKTKPLKKSFVKEQIVEEKAE